MTIKLGMRLEYTHTGSKRRLSEINDTFQYVPILESLRSLLSHVDIYDEVSGPAILCMANRAFAWSCDQQ